MNEARIEKGEKKIPKSRFTGRNQGFLVSVLRPNWPLFEECLKEVIQERAPTLEDIIKEKVRQAISVA